MDRPSRRAAAGRDAGDTNTSSSSLRHRRRHNASRTNSTTSASQSDDDGDTDASSVAPHDASTSSNTRTASKKLMPPRDAKKRASQRESENPAVDENGAADADGEADDDDELDDEEDEQSGNESRGPSAGGSEASGKRERSMSNVSTTSSSSSVASERDDRNLETMHVEKLKELEKKKQMVEDGTLAEFCRRVTEFKEERNQLLETAEWHKNLQLKNSEDLYGFEVQRAHDLWEQGKEALKGSLLQQVDALVLKLTQELADLSQVANGATEEATDGDAALEATEQEGTASEPDSETTTRTKGLAPVASKRRKVSTAAFQETTVRLPLDDIHSDLAAILGDRVQYAEDAAARLETKALATFRSDRRRLYCGKYVFEDGDEVVVSSPVISEDYIGTISSVTEDAVYIKLTTGQSVRVYLELIERKRCYVRPFLRGSVGVRALQGSGWPECEPF